MHDRDFVQISAVIGAFGYNTFGEQLDTLTVSIADFDMSCIFAFRFNGEPCLIHDGYSATVSRKALHSYMRGGYLLDPFYVACISGHESGLWRMDELAPDSFFSSDFVISHDIHPCVSSEAGVLIEEIGFVVPLGEGVSATYSLMRNQGKPPFSTTEFSRLKAAEPLIKAAIQAHWKQVKPAGFVPVLSGDDDVETMFLNVFADQLTGTQRNVARMILRGHSNISIANILGITEGTAKLHRSNIYKRLTITSQTELFQLFINYLSHQ
ncbi:helix-turn-helix transcriptional regulator [Ochrobactrum sp. CM-21-5]|nr:helix-turn-helix transcriptional regulator [Ochrobactrum sp. CM-21-5]MBC2886316.1 helix-turn-helix transcriptional regulator [Ochrobactrum sp. CM-21-5]